MDSTRLVQKLIAKQNLTSQETEAFLIDVMKERITPSQIAAFLVALRMKGETSEEIAGFISAMKKNMIRVQAPRAIDVCGTGGDGSGTFNISTAVAFVLAGAGVKVAKHGNRAASSSCGSADVLEELGVNLQLSSKQAEAVFTKVGMVFLFAPLFHPAMKTLVTIRKEIKVRTVFNYLGPFVSPASVEAQLIGVPDVAIAKKLAEVGKILSYKRLFIVTSEDGLDEISISSKTTLFEVTNHGVRQSTIDPKEHGFRKGSKKEVLGADVRQNARIIREVLEGRKNARRDIVILNSAYAFLAAGVVTDSKQGIRLAEQSIGSGRAAHILENLIKETQKYA